MGEEGKAFFVTQKVLSMHGGDFASTESHKGDTAVFLLFLFTVVFFFTKMVKIVLLVINTNELTVNVSTLLY